MKKIYLITLIITTNIYPSFYSNSIELQTNHRSREEQTTILNEVEILLENEFINKKETTLTLQYIHLLKQKLFDSLKKLDSNDTKALMDQTTTIHSITQILSILTLQIVKITYDTFWEESYFFAKAFQKNPLAIEPELILSLERQLKTKTISLHEPDYLGTEIEDQTPSYFLHELIKQLWLEKLFYNFYILQKHLAVPEDEENKIIESQIETIILFFNDLCLFNKAENPSLKEKLEWCTQQIIYIFSNYLTNTHKQTSFLSQKEKITVFKWAKSETLYSTEKMQNWLLRDEVIETLKKFNNQKNEFASLITKLEESNCQEVKTIADMIQKNLINDEIIECIINQNTEPFLTIFRKYKNIEIFEIMYKICRNKIYNNELEGLLDLEKIHILPALSLKRLPKNKQFIYNASKKNLQLFEICRDQIKKLITQKGLYN
ncbi:MAG: hypothetical protein UR26_C0001G0118 [candidate division TM6 bacterium GW2011_GWF2_32_72]|nr:MAG: hypothetical protein UR26_C0001G0118 [candidate division TM6 bacterium GW2011_GWF2_32_72]